MIKLIIWDMDGTLADLYEVEGWLPMLRAEDPTPYAVAKPMWDMGRLGNVLARLMKQGVDNRIVSWLSKDSSEDYKTMVREVKRQWLDDMDFPFSHFHGVQYGATKADSVRRLLNEGEEALLIDDNAKVRRGWHLGPAVDPAAVDIIELLEGLLEEGETR